MGDHRGNSADSAGVRTGATTAVIGRAWLRYWPIDTLKILPTPRATRSSRHRAPDRDRAAAQPRVVNPGLVAIAGVAIAGAVVAGSARDPRGTVLGLLVVLLATPLLADPWPGPLPILARVAAALLAARFLTIGLRGESRTRGSTIGWPAEACIAAAAAAGGYGAQGLGAPAFGPPEAQAAAFALVALAVAPLITGRDVLRLGVGAILFVQAAVLIRQALDPAASAGEQLVTALLTIALGGAVAVIAAAASAGGGLAVLEEPLLGAAISAVPDGRSRPRASGLRPVFGRRGGRVGR